MSDKKIWFITGAGRGMGTDFATAALAAPRRFIAGTDAIGMAEQKVGILEQQIDAYREPSSSLAHNDATAGVV